MPPPGLDQAAFIEKVRIAAEAGAAIRTLFLAGSFGRGDADSRSNVDFLGVARPEEQDRVGRAWRELLERLVTVVFWNERRSAGLLLSAVTEDWLRCDLSIQPPEALGRFARNALRPVLDPDGLHGTLRASLAPKPPDPDRVRGLADEFIRVLGLLAVVGAREEYVTAVTGVGLQRDHLIGLMLEEAAVPDRGGALHLSRVLPPRDMAILRALPYPGPVRAEVIEAHLAIARCFLPRAKALAERLGLDWPERFEAATRRALERELGQETNLDW